MQCIMLHIHQYSVHKPGAELYIANWMLHNNHVENKNQEVADRNISLHTISAIVDIPICTSIKDIKVATEENAELQMLRRYIF